MANNIKNAATQKMIENILDGTTPPEKAKKVVNPITIKVNGTVVTTFDGSAGAEVDIAIPSLTVGGTAVQGLDFTLNGTTLEITSKR